MDHPRPLTRDDLHPEFVESSIRELQRLVEREQAALQDLHRTADDVAIPSAAASLAIMAAAYDAAARADPVLPFGDSVLPALLALRKTHQVTAESQAYLAEGPADGTGSSLDTLGRAQAQLARDKTRLADQQALQKALEARLAEVQATATQRSSLTAEQRRAETRAATVAGLESKKKGYDSDTAALVKALREFIQTRLGAMLAAEELGGPVVGSMVDVQGDDLAAGFSAQGKLRRAAKADATPATKSKQADSRQRRIDEIWGRPEKEGEEDDDNDEADHEADDNDNDRDEAAAAAAEMQELTETLLNELAQAGRNTTAAYVRLSRESAAARFLVRSKVAQFHPRDATQLRLVDFGRELDD